MLLMLLACSGAGELALSDFEITWNEDTADLLITRLGRTLLDLRGIELGVGSAEVAFQSGSYRFDEEPTQWRRVDRFKLLSRTDSGTFIADLRDAEGDSLGLLQIYLVGEQELSIHIDSTLDTDRARISLACTGDDTFLGAGGHAMDVDHTGQSFPLFVSEPGVGKTQDEETPDTWFLTGTRHASSYPDPFLLRPAEPAGYQVNTGARVEVDLCDTDPGQWSMTAWEGDLSLSIFAGLSPLGVVGVRTLAIGGVSLPPDWAFAPWADAVHGQDRVLTLAQTLRDAGAPTSVIWTEDWKGGETSALGYHLLPEWDLDTTLYPDAVDIDAELESQGFKWLAYFSPFISPEASTWDEAAPHAITDPATGEPYTFLSATLYETSTLDLTDPDAWSWAQEKMQAAMDIGFDGWMADFGEWLPPDAELHDGDAMTDHNAWPLLWSALNAEAIEGTDATFFARSGWAGGQSLAPITWAGDQRTSFDADDGLPTVVAMGLGLSVSGVAFYGHDIAGYQSVGNDPSDRELWWRWCSLGAFSPIMRTHHGAYGDDNWQLDTDAETLAHYAAYATEHTRLFPYLRGLAAVAEQTGYPLIRHPAMHYQDADWAAMDAWLLGESMLVAPILERGVTSRAVALPADVGWYDWWTGQPASAGDFSADIGEIPVFVSAGSIIPLLTEAPDTLATATAAGVTDLSDADTARTLRVFGTSGSFTEADGTTYTASGTATASGSATQTLTDGDITVSGLTVTISGSTERTYTVEVHP
jgi:alpha-glucosidase